MAERTYLAVNAAYAVAIAAYVHARLPNATQADVRAFQDMLPDREHPDSFDEVVSALAETWDRFIREREGG